jgi:alkylation response protein AidB-like acyl-CoA dehydrogenase
MNLELTDEQTMLREAAAGTLARHDTIANAREARDGAELIDLWPVAREAGWTGLLVSEEHGGAGLGLYDAMLVLTECGRRLAGAGLIGHLAASAVLQGAADAGDQAAGEVLGEIATGERRAAIVFARPPATGDGWQVEAPGAGAGTGPLPAISADDSVSGVAGYQPDLAGAEVIVVPVADGDAVGAVLLAGDADGLEIERIVRSDATRPLANLAVVNASATRLAVDSEGLEAAWDIGQALLAADALGVCEATLEMAVAYAKDRQAFARPIGSYQSVKHQLVEIMHRTEKLRSLCIYTALAADAKPDELSLATATARLAGEQAADYATRTCLAVHGGIGATWEHDGPWYWRRAQLSRVLLGGEAGAADRITEQLIKAHSTTKRSNGA